ncbi:hypothetical protein WS72_30730 [Burkholderia savannae]|uniref:Uncharacterized protein n=1 Tax=Burkholderia savannae TaxID=1637837 RepID=A0ABR5T8L9_9BURK|nr:hypothetical protein WS72_30730 [Burkholderia savannae]
MAAAPEHRVRGFAAATARHARAVRRASDAMSRGAALACSGIRGRGGFAFRISRFAFRRSPFAVRGNGSNGNGSSSSSSSSEHARTALAIRPRIRTRNHPD